MKKFTLLLVFLLLSFYANAQFSTGVVALNTSMDVTIATDASQVTLTLKGPLNKWFAVGFGGSSMGAVSDVFLYDGTGNFDKVGHNHSTPTDDTNQDWTIVSNTATATDRTIVATRSLSTSDASDFTFMNSASNIPVIYAYGSGMTLANHNGNRGTDMLPRTSTASIDEQAELQFVMYPNPVQTELNIVLPSTVENAEVEIYNVIGKKIDKQQIKDSFNTINVSDLEAGIYIIKIKGNNGTYGVKQFIKE